MSTNRYALIIAGGSGSRLWPMSRRALPKQFQYLLDTETPFQHMVRLATQVIPLERVYIMAVPEFTEIILSQVPGLSKEQILFEPMQRDTGPAVTLGMLHVAARDPEATVATLWSDHLVLDEEGFASVLEAAFLAAEKHKEALIAVGTKPTKADPSLGYIHMDGSIGTFNGVGVHKVLKFIEKPDQTNADKFFHSWEYLWNVGYNVMNVSSFTKEIFKAQPEHKEVFEELQEALSAKNIERISEAYEKLPKISIDFFLVQKLETIFVVPADMGWSDIGTWSTLHRMMVTKSGQHMVTQGEVKSINSKNSLVFAKDRPITLVGVENLIVVDTGDTLLVMHHDAPAADLKTLVQETLTKTNPELL
jgi:mannose-1-phosphate guanylyltransferase